VSQTTVDDTTRQVGPPIRSPIKSFTLRCIIWRAPDESFFAECIDLDIAVHGRSQAEAERKMRSAITSYLKVVLSGDPAGLLPRPAPWSHRLRYHLYAALAAVISARRSFRLMELSSECLCHS
jgi:hypothetical protein